MTSKKAKKVSLCTLCKKPATRTVDGEASCEQHAQQIYEHQLEDYTRDRVLAGNWPETSTRERTIRKAHSKSAELVTKT
jgi:hypothetical protein